MNSQEERARWVEVERITVGRIVRLTDERDEARATIARVKALHTSKDNGSDVEWCAHDMHGWPCPTIRALDTPEPAASAPEPQPGHPAHPDPGTAHQRDEAVPDGYGDGLGSGQIVSHDFPGRSTT